MIANQVRQSLYDIHNKTRVTSTKMCFKHAMLIYIETQLRMLESKPTT